MEAVAHKYDSRTHAYFVAKREKPGKWPTGPGRYTVDRHGVNKLRARRSGLIGRLQRTEMEDVWFSSSRAALKTVINSART